MIDSIIILAVSLVLGLYIHHKTKNELLLKNSRSEALRELLRKVEYEATHKYER